MKHRAAVAASVLAFLLTACAVQQDVVHGEGTIAVEDDAGTIMVKRYRLVLPEEE